MGSAVIHGWKSLDLWIKKKPRLNLETPKQKRIYSGSHHVSPWRGHGRLSDSTGMHLRSSAIFTSVLWCGLGYSVCPSISSIPHRAKMTLHEFLKSLAKGELTFFTKSGVCPVLDNSYFRDFVNMDLRQKHMTSE